MTTSGLVIIALAVIALVACVRLMLRARSQPSKPWRTVVLLAAQPVGATLLYFALLPPPDEVAGGSLIVLTGGTAALPRAQPGDRIVALPEASATGTAERMPDLATALRRHPGARPVRLYGVGLAPRDVDAARGPALEFAPAPLPAGIVDLQAPTQALRGRRFDVHGRVEGAGKDGDVLDLLDPAGERVDRTRSDGQGRFHLSAVVGPAGRIAYTLLRRTADDAVAESVPLPLQVQDPPPLRVLVLAGGASPELKYLRRWALDAGMKLHTRISLGGGMDIGDPPLPVNAATLGQFDLVVLDDRAWRGLGAGGRAALRDATRAGLGLLLRITADPSAADRDELAKWGFVLAPAELIRGVRLAGTETADAGAAPASDEVRANDTAPLLSRRPLRLAAGDGAALLRDAAGETLALWRAEGRGRIGVWTLADSFQLQLSGRRAAYGNLWAHTFATLARPTGAPAPALPQAARIGERTVLCGLPAGATLAGADGRDIALAWPSPRAPDDCAAFWPTRAGWFELRAGGQAWAFPVRAADEAPGLAAAARRDATLALVRDNAFADGEARPIEAPGPRWPWFLGWLLVASATWWLERSRAGRRTATV